MLYTAAEGQKLAVSTGITSMRTNRDFYLAIKALPERYDGSQRLLGEYLLACLALAESRKDKDAFTLTELFEFLQAAFTSSPAQLQDEWFQQYDNLDENSPGFAGWRALVIKQIVDLREMSEAGILDKEFACFGVSSPRGYSWYNFHPFGYLECAAEGTFGGWQAEDTDRIALSPSAGTDPPEEIDALTWEDLSNFMHCGRVYE